MLKEGRAMGVSMLWKIIQRREFWGYLSKKLFFWRKENNNYYFSFSSHGVAGVLEPSPAVTAGWRWRRGYTLDESAVNHRATQRDKQPFTLITHTYGEFNVAWQASCARPWSVGGSRRTCRSACSAASIIMTLGDDRWAPNWGRETHHFPSWFSNCWTVYPNRSSSGPLNDKLFFWSTLKESTHASITVREGGGEICGISITTLGPLA